jgi:peptide/nickel transport system substrate-binding protein
MRRLGGALGLETGEFDYAWNLQLDPQILPEMAEGGKGTAVVTAFGTSVERLHLNQTNPDPALPATCAPPRSGPHPFLTNPVIGQAMSMAIDRRCWSRSATAQAVADLQRASGT